MAGQHEPEPRLLADAIALRYSGCAQVESVALGGSLALGPVAMVCFNWFEEGGRLAYDGFGFGSFMFRNMAMQILGYYAVAAVLIPLGYGHLTLRCWVPPVTLALIWSWVVLGAPLLIVLLFILLAAKELSVGAGADAALLTVLSYVALPGLPVRF